MPSSQAMAVVGRRLPGMMPEGEDPDDQVAQRSDMQDHPVGGSYLPAKSATAQAEPLGLRTRGQFRTGNPHILAARVPRLS